MGTRADFYVRHSETDLEWLGSVAYDGYDIEAMGDCETEQDFRQTLSEFFDARDHATYAREGFPWPWRDSRLTDHAYVWVDQIGLVRREGDDYPRSNIGNKTYVPDDGECSAYISVRRENELHREADREGAEYHPLWDAEVGFRNASCVDTRYIYPDMLERQQVRLDGGSGILILG